MEPPPPPPLPRWFGFEEESRFVRNQTKKKYSSEHSPLPLPTNT